MYDFKHQQQEIIMETLKDIAAATLIGLALSIGLLAYFDVLIK